MKLTQEQIEAPLVRLPIELALRLTILVADPGVKSVTLLQHDDTPERTYRPATNPPRYDHWRLDIQRRRGPRPMFDQPEGLVPLFVDYWKKLLDVYQTDCAPHDHDWCDRPPTLHRDGRVDLPLRPRFFGTPNPGSYLRYYRWKPATHDETKNPAAVPAGPDADFRPVPVVR